MYVIELILLMMIVVYIIDVSGVVNSLKRLISNILTKGTIITDNYSLPLFGCSLCMTFWCGLIYLIVNQVFTIPYISLVCLLSLLTTPTKDLLLGLREWLLRLTNRIY